MLNLEHTVAVTQNFASSANFPSVWADVADKRPGLAAFWLHQLDQAALQRPHLRPLVSLAREHLRTLADTRGTTEAVHSSQKAVVNSHGLPPQAAIVAFLQRRRDQRQEEKLNKRVARELTLATLVVDHGVEDSLAQEALASSSFVLSEALSWLRQRDMPVQ